MNEQDKQAFEAALVERCKTTITVPQDFSAGWQAALKYARGKQEPVAHVWFEDNNGASRKHPKDCQRFGANGVPCAVWVGERRYVPEAHPAPAVAQIIPGDSLFHCVSDLENSATYDSHSEMQNCIRSVAQRIKALAGKDTAVAVNEQMYQALLDAYLVLTLSDSSKSKNKAIAQKKVFAAIAAAEAAKGAA